MAVNNFIPKVWSARLQENLHKALVFGSLCNRNWEGEIAQWGDTVHITNLSDITVRPYTPNTDIEEPEQLSGEDVTLVIDHGAYYNFFLNDVDAAQARADLMDAAMRNAALKLAEDTENYIMNVILEGAGTKNDTTIPDDDVYTLLLFIKAEMDMKHVPKYNRKLIVPAMIESKLLMDSRFLLGSSGENRLAEGSIARVAGFDIYVSNDLEKQIVAMTPEAVTFANQLTKTEAYRREKGFDDGVKGLSLCGCKVVQPDSVFVYTLID